MKARAPEGFLTVRDIADGTVDLDIEFWQTQGPEAIFRAAWEMVVHAHRLKGGNDDELRLQRTLEVVDIA